MKNFAICNFHSIHVAVKYSFPAFIPLSGLSPKMLLVAEQRLLDYKTNPEVVFETMSDLEIEGVELIKALPLGRIKLQCVKQYTLVVTCVHKPSLYFELCNTRLEKNTRQKIWNTWVNFVMKIQKGIPLTATPAVPTKTPIYTLYSSEEGL